MNMSTATGCIFYLFCFFILFSPVAQSGENKKAAGARFSSLKQHVAKIPKFFRKLSVPVLKYFEKVPNMKHSIKEPTVMHLEGEYTQFYNSMLLPLVNKCPLEGPWESSFDHKDRFFLLNGEKKLCQYVIQLNELFTTMDQRNQIAQLGNQQTKTLAVENDGNIPQQIYDHIRTHNNNLMDDCGYGACHRTFIIEKMREDLNNQFKQNFKKMIKTLEEKRVPHTDDCQMRAYELLLIGQKMGKYFKTTEEEQMEWAFQLFAAQLAVYSLRLDKLPKSAHKKGGIYAIAQRWQIGMKTQWTHLREYMQFYDLMILSLVDACPENSPNWNSSFDVRDRFSMNGGEKLCRYVIELDELFTKFYRQKSTSEEEKEGQKALVKNVENDNILLQIHDLILSHNDVVINDFSTKSSDSALREINDKMPKIKAKKENLNDAFKDKFGQLMKELENKENAEDVQYWSREIAYKLLEIGNQMKNVFTANGEEQMELAFQLFAAQLAVYSLRLDKLPKFTHYRKIGIQAIAQSWPIGMKMDIEKAAADKHRGMA